MLIESGFLVAVFNKADRHHRSASVFARDNPIQGLVPDVALTEVTYLLRRDGGPQAVDTFLRSFIMLDLPIECVSMIDLARAHEIMIGYPEARLDFVDCCVMALAERLNVTRILTYDRRDFAIVRPRHCDYFELMP